MASTLSAAFAVTAKASLRVSTPKQTRRAMNVTTRASVSEPEKSEKSEVSIRRHIEQRLQRLIVRAKGIVSEEMLVRHQREIPVDEIPDYAVTHLLAQLGERELQLQRY